MGNPFKNLDTFPRRGGMLILHAGMEGRGWKREGGKKLSCLKMRDTISRLPPSLCYCHSSREDYGPSCVGAPLFYIPKYSFTCQSFYVRF